MVGSIQKGSAARGGEWFVLWIWELGGGLAKIPTVMCCWAWLGRVEWDFSKEDGKQENPSKRISGLSDEGGLQGCAGARETEGHRGRK